MHQFRGAVVLALLRSWSPGAASSWEQSAQETRQLEEREGPLPRKLKSASNLSRLFPRPTADGSCTWGMA